MDTRMSLFFLNVSIHLKPGGGGGGDGSNRSIVRLHLPDSHLFCVFVCVRSEELRSSSMTAEVDGEQAGQTRHDHKTHRSVKAFVPKPYAEPVFKEGDFSTPDTRFPC